jgi:hypothetical protein
VTDIAPLIKGDKGTVAQDFSAFFAKLSSSTGFQFFSLL